MSKLSDTIWYIDITIYILYSHIPGYIIRKKRERKHFSWQTVVWRGQCGGGRWAMVLSSTLVWDCRSARLTNFSGRRWISPNQVPDTHWLCDDWVKGIHCSGVEHHCVWLTGTGEQRWVKGARGVGLVRQEERRQTRRETEEAGLW